MFSQTTQAHGIKQMENQYKPYIVSDVSSDLIEGIGAVDRTVFCIQEVKFWQEHNAKFLPKWKGKAKQALAELEALTDTLRKQVEAL